MQPPSSLLLKLQGCEAIQMLQGTKRWFHFAEEKEASLQSRMFTVVVSDSVAGKLRFCGGRYDCLAENPTPAMEAKDIYATSEGEI